MVKLSQYTEKSEAGCTQNEEVSFQNKLSIHQDWARPVECWDLQTMTAGECALFLREETMMSRIRAIILDTGGLEYTMQQRKQDSFGTFGYIVKASVQIHFTYLD